MKKELKFVSLFLIAMLVIVVPAFAVQTGFTTFPQISVTLINNEPDPVAPGSTVNMKFRIENEGGGPAEDVEAKLVLKHPFSFYGEEEVKNVGTVAGSQTNDIGVREDWTLLVDSEAISGNHIVEFWYRIDQGSWIKSGDYTVSIRSRDAVLAINEIKTDYENIVPGTKTKVSFVLENLADNTLIDIKLKLDILAQLTTSTSISYRELPFTPIGSGNEKTLKNLMPGKSQEIVFDLFTDADAESKVHKVPFTLTYSDAAGTNFTREGIVGLIVESFPDLSINIESNQAKTAGAKGIIEIKIVNKGFSDVKFLNVILSEGDQYEILSNPEVYVGKLDSDDYETADYTLQISKLAKDKVMLPLTIDYRDANGKLFQREIELDFKVDKPKSPVVSIIIWIIIIIIIVGAIILIRKRRKKRRAIKD
ncbi:MAG: hypothetical protein KKF46_07985 [Nanoarchaeota archaeon]|nr:hypothetical protein [Nanoarchaeota archaeon]MBU1322267.1 hypothetical protein [Nanoarchaeota archaeon]MBU1598020.1 hypothetical protein [Nanoarchaeota archaeon]MBU2441014.1 hypothetical protein [Nanoarchaeota archaeon]